MLELKLFGNGQASYFNTPLEGFPYHRAFLILCYLLINKGRPLHRERLAAVFWGDCPTITARKYLRNSLWRLRHTFEIMGIDSSRYLDITDEHVAFIENAPYWLDIERFEMITTDYRKYKGDDLLQEQASELAKVIDLYTGDLLEGIYEDWCLYDRERFRLIYLDTLNKLMVYCTTSGEYDQGIYFGERILKIDNTRETVHRQMMLLHWLSGNQSGALSQFKRCAQILQEEMGIQPMEKTLELYERIAHNQFKQGTVLSQNNHHLNTDVGLNPSGNNFDVLAQHLGHLKEMINQINKEIIFIQELVSPADSNENP